MRGFKTTYRVPDIAIPPSFDNTRKNLNIRDEIPNRFRDICRFCRFWLIPTSEGKVPLFSKNFDETQSDGPGHQKNDPDLQRRRTLKWERRNGRFSAGPKIAKRAKNHPKKYFFRIFL